jgi:tetratricopeptide (TPR) repeat protein
VVLTVAVGGEYASRQTQTPAEQRIAAAERLTRSKPSADAFNRLALALAARARETADPAYYQRAEKAIDESLRLAPDNFEGRKARVWVWLGQHQFAAALDLAQILNKQVPDDLLVYGFLTDAHVELGNYKEAEEACQWMLDLRPGNIPAYTRAAYLREIFGDFDGAIELMTKSYERTPVEESEERAWLLSQIGHLFLLAGRTRDAEQVLNDALALFPNYHYALANLARLRRAEGRHAAAAELFKRRYDAAPHPENLYELGRALDRAGQQAEAQAAFKRFEAEALVESKSWDNANRELIFYYVDVAKKPADALAIASREVQRRRDVYTLDAYAWALYANGRIHEAQEQIQRALDVGIRDPAVLERAALIKKSG